MTREELYEAVTAALVQHKHTDFTDAVTVVIDVVEPLIRADEVERRFGWVSQEDAHAWFLANLREMVSRQIGGIQELADLDGLNEYGKGELKAYNRMLDMIDGNES